MKNNTKINEDYTRFYSARMYKNVYPTEFVVRTFLASYPELKKLELPKGATILDIGCGDGRNTLFLMEQGYNVYGTEIAEEIVKITQDRLDAFAGERSLKKANIAVGRNSSLSYPDKFFDVILACHVCYYCDDGENIGNNLCEYARVLKDDGLLVASVLHSESYVLRGGITCSDGTTIVRNDPYNNRNGYRLKGYATTKDIESDFEELFCDFSFGQGHNNWYGIDENVWWCVCRKK